MNATDKIKQYYAGMPWMAALRAVEVECFHQIRDACADPVLDLGCGDGFIASVAFERRLAAGVDIEPHVLEVAAKSGAYESVQKADARHLPFEDASFNTVFSNGAMEHMNDLPQVLGEIARVLKPGGVLVTLVPSHKFKWPVGRLAKCLGRRVWDAFNRLHNHVNLLSPEEWREQLAAHGLSVRRCVWYADETLAAEVTNHDLASKLHVTKRWPFIRLQHCGNLGGLLARLFQSEPVKPRDARGGNSDSGYSLLIEAVRQP